jgi:hypothetical protein
MPFRTRHRIWTIDMDDGSWAASCERCGDLGRGTAGYVEWIAEIHAAVNAA